MDAETIVAVATPPGRGGVGIVRLSGKQALPIALKLTHRQGMEPRKAHFSLFYSEDNSLIDKGISLWFQAPHSFTGEDVVELQAHGSPMVLDCLLNECVALGARLARPGEFSERAFLNDKMDLTQAEAIADLIHASSQTAARMAVRSLQGDFSSKINVLNEKLVHLRLFVEAAIDFPEEEIDFLSDGKVSNLLNEIMKTLQEIQSCASQGVLLQEGLTVVIAGRPNAGKSTLINALAGREVAIVTDVAGTTRDVMREHVVLDGIPLHVVDTAGLRDSEDRVEQEGIKRAWQELSRADCVLLVKDINDDLPFDALSAEIRASLPEGVVVIHVVNKVDTHDMPARSEEDTVYLAAISGEGLELLAEKIKAAVGYRPEEGQFLARRRHLQALNEAYARLEAGRLQLETQRAGELLAEDLRLAHLALCEITGEFSSDDLLGEIFSSFCIGK